MRHQDRNQWIDIGCIHTLITYVWVKIVRDLPFCTELRSKASSFAVQFLLVRLMIEA